MKIKRKASYLLGISILLLMFVTAASCRVRTTYSVGPNGMPPGQEKKLTGSKSAKPYAPGQQKKMY